ncbi:MAG: proline dehydrogenase family protein [Actinomycetota bacterium]
MTTPAFRMLVGWMVSFPWVRWVVSRTRPGRAVASRFVAGESLDSGIVAVRALEAEGIAVALSHLGENVAAPWQADAAAAAYVRSIERLSAEPGLDCSISVKLTQLGLDVSKELCVSELERVLDAGERLGMLVTIDMESSTHVDRTLDVFRELRARHEGLGICLQSCLRRTPADLETLPGGSVVRLVKGAYLEPSEIALPRRRDVDLAFARCFVTLLARGHTVHVATHDQRLLNGARRIVERDGVPRSRVEFQMLYGVRRDLQTRLARQGCPVRVYVPYGSDWYPYLARRLAERPANMWFFLSNLVRTR